MNVDVEVLTWIGLGLALAALLLLARRNLYLGMTIAALVLGLFTVPGELGPALLAVLADPGIMLLALVVALIPLIGGALEETGLMESLVENLRLGRRAFLALAPALLGMLPMPGGALLSAPLVARGGGVLDGAHKAAVNVWFRHVLYLVYPLGPALIAAAKVAQLEVYRVIPWLFPFFLLSLLLGYAFLLRRAGGEPAYAQEFSPRGLLLPLGVILVAPLLDFLLRWSLRLPVRELGTLAGVGTSLLAVSLAGRLGDRLGKLILKMRVWRFSLIILGMFFFLEVFQRSGVPGLIARLELPGAVLGAVIGPLLGLITGRIQAPVTVIFPVFLARGEAITPLTFALIFYAVFLGYILTPVHPCIAVSVEYFKTSLREFIRVLRWPAALAWLAALLLSLFLFPRL